MGFLSELTTVQRAGGAAILVLGLVLLLVKQRQAKGAPAAKATDAKKGKTSKKREAAPKAAKKSRSFGAKRKKKGDDDATMPVAEPKAGSGRMVPRLPSPGEAMSDVPAMEPVAFPETTDAMVAEPMAAAVEGGMIQEPGWPTPGEVWAADAPVAEPVEAWQDDAQDDALAALTEAPEPDTSEWTNTDAVSEPIAGWDAPAEPEDVEVPAAESDATWQAEAEEGFDWAAGDAIDGWATSAPSEPAEELASGEAAWEAPEDETPAWSAAETTTWETPESVEEAAPVATAVAEEFTVGEWTPAVEDEPVAEVETPEIVWDPVDEVEEVEAVEATFVEPVVEAEPVAVTVEEPVVEAEPVEEPAFAFAEVELEDFDMQTAVPAMAVAAVSVADPASRWASMAPGGVTAPRTQSNPVESWTRLRPGHGPATNGTNGHAPAATATAVAPAPPLPAPVEVTSPSLAWWDVPASMESDPRRGRFALGGYALQPGHQVVSGVTFRDGVVPPPAHWVIGPVVGDVAPGTLVLNVDGCLNCRPEDLAVLMDPGFAPTTDGFSLRLAASATGPFAASGTYTIS
jgi:hypothetical protein